MEIENIKKSSAPKKKIITEDEKKYLEWRKNNIKYPAVSSRSLDVTFSLLSSKKDKLTVSQQRRRALCKGMLHCPLAFDTPTVIFKAIRTSILTKNWNALNELLLILLTKNKIYAPYLRNVSKFLELLCIIRALNTIFSFAK